MPLAHSRLEFGQVVPAMTARLLILATMIAATAWPQPVLTPTPDRPGAPEKRGGYTVSNSFETGYRFATVGGNRDVYDSSVNFGNGVRLFEGELRIDSLDGKNKWLDEFAFNVRGGPGDPYQSNVVKAEKHGLYRYDLQLRTTEYYNRLPALWEGEHSLRTQRTLQSHNLILRPGSRFEILLGYDRNRRTGPGFFSEGIPSAAGAFRRTNFLRLAQDVRQENNEYRAGFNLRAGGLLLTATQALDNYKDDTTFGETLIPSVLPNMQLTSGLSRSEPFHGNTHITQVAVRTERERWIGFQGNFAYVEGRRNSVLSESVTGTATTGASTLRQTFVFGDAGRTQGSGEFTVTLLPSAKWTLTNTVSANNMRIDGTSDLLEVSIFRNQLLQIEHLGVRHIANATEANYRPTDQLGLYGAYRHSERRVRTQSSIPQFNSGEPLLGVDNSVDVGAAGIRWTPMREIRASLDVEIGRADQPLTPVSPRKFHNERARVSWRRDGFSVAGFFKNEINDNRVALSDYSSDRQSAGASVFWADADGNVMIDGGYSWLSASTSAGIFNLINPGQAARTVYESNLHTLQFSAQVRLQKRATLYLGYTSAKDTGDGRDVISISGNLTPTYPSYSFDGANFFVSLPLTYQSPQARLTIAISDRLAWNFGWQYYSYEERFTG
ncbi:MAG: hypothetical protein O3A53_03665 [Acidobacteria bacterium]|nr:hypothetical protein [Acidobacteriota bacterium]